MKHVDSCIFKVIKPKFQVICLCSVFSPSHTQEENNKHPNPYTQIFEYTKKSYLLSCMDESKLKCQVQSSNGPKKMLLSKGDSLVDRIFQVHNSIGFKVKNDKCSLRLDAKVNLLLIFLCKRHKVHSFIFIVFPSCTFCENETCNSQNDDSLGLVKA